MAEMPSDKKETDQMLQDYDNATAAISQQIQASEQKYNAIMLNLDPDWAEKQTANKQDVHAESNKAELDEQMKKLRAEYDHNTDMQNAAQRMEHSNNYMNKMQQVISDANAQKLSDINADLMTSKRMTSINTEAVVRLEDDTQYLRSFIIAMCVAVLVMVLCTSKVVTLPVANIILCVVALALVIALIVHAVNNSNRYRMLFPERDWPLHKDPSELDEECACAD